MSRRRRARVALLVGPSLKGAVGLAVLLALVSSVTPPPASAQKSPLAAVQAVLDARVAAVKTGDRAAFLATVDPEAPRKFREAQARHFDGLRSVPLSFYKLRARVDQTGDLGPGVAASHRGRRIFLPVTESRLRLGRYDDRDAVTALWLTFVLHKGRWLVTSDTDLETVGLETSRELWDLGPVRVQSTEHFLVLSRPDQAERAKALAAVAEDALAPVDQRWRLPWSRRVPLILPGSTEELETLLQSTVDLDKFVAFASYGADRDEGFEPTAARVYVNDRNLAGYPRASQVETLTHELAHVAASIRSGPLVPIWIHEGVAELVARGPGAARRRPGGGALPRDDRFVSGPAAGIVRSYAEARAAISTLSRLAGPEAPTTLFAQVGGTRVVAGDADRHVEDALQRITGLRTAEFEQAWSSGR